MTTLAGEPETAPGQVTHKIENQWGGFRLSSADRADVVLLKPRP